VIVRVSKGLKVTTGKGTIDIEGIDKELVGAFAADVRALKKPEPFKGKGIRYAGEVIRRKQGKKSA
jgi:large subunit ribosomal protein L6